MTHELRPYQSEAITNLRKALASGHKRPVLQLPTGGGKTLVASEIIKLATQKGRRAIFTAPAIELIDQTVRKFWEHDIRDVGVLQASHPMTDPSRPVQVCSLQTLARRQIPPAHLVIVDEVHMQSKFLTDWMGREDWAHVPFIGLSATPWASGMGRLWDTLVIASTTKQMIDEGWLSPFRVFAASHPDLKGVKILAGDYQEDQLSKVMQKGTLTGDIVQNWLEKGNHLPTLCFAVDRAHARQLEEAFTKAGVSCGYVDGNTPKDERETIRKRFESGALEVVVNIGVLTTGIDWDVRCIILARPTKSEMLYTQILGRGLRTAPGKDCLTVFDHSDSTATLGFVTDIHHHRLSQGKLADAQVQDIPTPKPRECPQCHVLVPPKVYVCPDCGYKGGKTRESTVDVVPGELVELKGVVEKRANKKDPWETKIGFIRDLRRYAIEKGYQDAWTSHKYRERYGVWPNDPQVRYASPSDQVSMNTRSWLKSRQIAWAKAKERAQG